MFVNVVLFFMLQDDISTLLSQKELSQMMEDFDNLDINKGWWFNIIIHSYRLDLFVHFLLWLLLQLHHWNLTIGNNSTKKTQGH